MDTSAGCSPCACLVAGACDPYWEFSGFFSNLLMLGILVILAIFLSIGFLQTRSLKKLITKSFFALSMVIGIIGSFLIIFTFLLIWRWLGNLGYIVSPGSEEWILSSVIGASIIMGLALVTVITQNIRSRQLLKKTNKPINGILKYSPVVIAASLSIFVVVVGISAMSGGVREINPGTESATGAERCRKAAVIGETVCEY